MMKEKYLWAFMKTARIFGDLSTAVRRKVGAVIVKDNRIISIGYNGMPSGWTNECEEKHYKIDGWQVDEHGCYEMRTKPEVLHAESNSIAKLARSTESGEGAYMFVTCVPCLECAKMIYQSGISKVFYSEPYRNSDGLDFLHKCNVYTAHLPLNEPNDE